MATKKGPVGVPATAKSAKKFGQKPTTTINTAKQPKTTFKKGGK